MVRFFADQDMTEAEGIVGEFDSIADSGNPGQAVQHLVKCTNYVGNAFQFAVSAGIKEASGPIEVAAQIVDSAKANGSAIEASGKEQQKESLELRKLINGMIIAERKIIKENRRG